MFTGARAQTRDGKIIAVASHLLVPQCQTVPHIGLSIILFFLLVSFKMESLGYFHYAIQAAMNIFANQAARRSKIITPPPCPSYRAVSIEREIGRDETNGQFHDSSAKYAKYSFHPRADAAQRGQDKWVTAEDTM